MLTKSISNGAFLLSLESELQQDPAQIRLAILFQALLARHVCLTDFHLLDSPALRDFVISHRDDLYNEAQGAADSQFPSMFASCSRGGSDISAALNVMLDPNVKTRLPAYFSSLTRTQNEALRERYDLLTRPEARRSRFFRTAGEGFQEYIACLTRYFTTVPGSVLQGSDDQLYSDVEEHLELLKTDAPTRRLTYTDYRVIDALSGEIQATRQGQTRERLHLVIYDGRLPHYHQGIVEGADHPDIDNRHAWRHLINTFYNFNLARRFAANPVLNTSWFKMPARLTRAVRTPIKRGLENVTEIKLETALYVEYLTFPFVKRLRSLPEFWNSMDRMDRSRLDRDVVGFCSALSDHMKLVSARFAKHLHDQGRGDLVRARLVRLNMRNIEGAAFGSTAAMISVGLWAGLQDYAVELVAYSLAVGQAVGFTVTGLLSCVPVRFKTREFKKFETDLASFGRTLDGPR